MKEDSAPGPDEFSVCFYKSCCETIKGEIMAMVNDFYMGHLDLARLNYGVITLVPKVKNANNVKQFRPICLLNVSFKLFTKLINDRLAGVARKIISPNQTAFIKGTYIVDGVVMLHEIIHELSQKKMQGVILKIDFEKAYDSVCWDFIEEVMERKSFNTRLRRWIMSTIKEGKVCVIINRENGPYFRTFRGLRQGDPLSPLIFNLAADALDHILTKAKEKGHIKGVVPNPFQGELTHLQYADDTVVMVGCDENSIRNLKFLLYCFEWMSGLRINYHKSEVVAFGVDENYQTMIADTLNCKKGRLPMTYLGFPISDKKLKMEAFRGIVDKMRKKLQPWKGRNLTSRGAYANKHNLKQHADIPHGHVPFA
jgi:hypothetical protein